MERNSESERIEDQSNISDNDQGLLTSTFSGLNLRKMLNMFYNKIKLV